MNATALIPTMEAPHHRNLVAPFLGSTCKGPGTEGELRGFEVSFWTSSDCFGPAEPSNPWHLGNRVGNHSMWQAANLVETEGPVGNSVAVSATRFQKNARPDGGHFSCLPVSWRVLVPEGIELFPTLRLSLVCGPRDAQMALRLFTH